mgnify:CR=1 FL=1
MKRFQTLAILALGTLLAVSCGGRNAQKEADAPEDAAEEASVSKKAVRDSIPLPKTVGVLPEEPFFDIVTSMGTIRVKLYKDTPKHRDNFIQLSLSHFYDDVLFHRVIDGFMIQGGDPYTRDTSRVEEWGDGGPGYEIPAEFVPEHTHKKGALAAARRGDLANPMKESSGSQFYLVQDPSNCKHLDGAYTVFGEAVAGLSVIDRIAKVRTDRYDRPLSPVVIKNIRPNAEMNKRALEDGVPALQGLSVDMASVNIRQRDTTATGKEMVTTRKNGHVITRIKK